MITRIDVENIYSVGKASLSFEKGRYKFLDNLILNDKVSNPIAIYGRNGSGKTSLIMALFQVVNLLITDKDKLLMFIFNVTKMVENPKDKTIDITKAKVGIEFILNSKVFRYSLTTDYEAISYESLEVDDMLIFERSKKALVYKNETKEVEANYYPSLRELSNESSSDVDSVSQAYRFLSNIAISIDGNEEYLANTLGKKGFMEAMVDYSNDVKTIIREYKSFPVYGIKSKLNSEGKKSYYIDLEKSDGKTIELPFAFRSTGMASQSFLLTIVLSLPENGVLIVDEIEKNLHPLTIMNFFRVIREKNIQLIFTSHNTGILSKLRPDNIFFANWRDGYSEYRRLSDIYPNIREVNNIEKMYLSSSLDEAIQGE